MKFSSALLHLIVLIVGAVSYEEEGSPISKVLVLLKDLQGKIEKDGEADEADYKKYMCWCDEIQKSKKDLIEEQKKAITLLGTKIEAGNATATQLTKDVKVGDKKIGDHVESKDQAANVRKQEADQRLADAASNNETLKNLKAAEKMLAGAQQGGNGASANILAIVQDQYKTTDKREKEESAKEAKVQTAFSSWLDDMKAELSLLKQKQTETKTALVDTGNQIADNTERKDDTEETKKADEAFLAEATESCAARQKEYTTRSSLRVQELSGVNKALEILDARRAVFDKAFAAPKLNGSSFLQVDSRSQSTARAASRALAALKEKASKSSRLAALALRLQRAGVPQALDGVVQAIDKMVQTLKDEATVDKQKKEFCKQEYAKIASKVENLGFLIQKSSDRIGSISTQIEALDADFAKSKKELTGVSKTLQEIQDLRVKENALFLQSKKDDLAAIAALEETIAALKASYAPSNKASLIEYDPNDLSDKRKELKNKEHHYTLTDKDAEKGAADGILVIMGQVIDNLNKDIRTAQEAEAKNQLRFEGEQATLLDSQDKLLKKITSIEAMKATQSGERTGEETIKGNNEGELSAQKKYESSIKQECDWMLAKFDERVSKRATEMDGLARAKDLLKGAAFIQRSATPSPSRSSPPKRSSLMSYLLSPETRSEDEDA
jgi:hypothetical protein